MRSRDHVTTPEFVEAISQIANHGGGTVRWFVCESTEHERTLAATHGLRADAPLLHMRCTLPLDAKHQTPPGFVTRTFRPGIDNDEWLAVNARAFADHPEQGDWTHDVLNARTAEPWFDAQGFLLHEIDGRIAGFCWTKVHEGGDGHTHGHQHADDGHTHGDAPEHTMPIGEIYVIGVDPTHHGKGLGRSLTIAGFAHLSALGLRHGLLYVAADNSPAIALYESLGMRVAHSDDVYVGSIVAA